MDRRIRWGVRLLLGALAACALAATPAAATPLASAASPRAPVSQSSNPFEYTGPLVPQIINGQEASIAGFPWQVYVLVVNEREGTESSCGGSILNATTILTAAHCTDHEGTTNPVTPEEASIYVVAGASHGLTFGPTHPSPESYQAQPVTSVRRDPYYSVTPSTKDDVALLTLEKPLELSAARNAEAISLVPTGATPAPGTPLSISGYGKEEGAEGVNSNGNLYSTTLTAISSDACRSFVGVDSAVLLCAQSASSSTCQGDSGGPLTEGNPAVQVGIVDFGAKECPVGLPDVFTNVAAPEVRGFIEGSESPPVAARPTSPPVLKSIASTPVDFSPLTCEPGAWSGSPSFTYTFQVENASAQLLQSAPGNIFTPPSTLIGSPLVCIVQAANPGGVTTVRTATSPAIAADTTPPVSSITGLPRCHLQTCTLSISASDPNAVAFSLQSSAAYSVIARCPKKRKKKKRAKAPVCHQTKAVPMSVVNPSAGDYTASVSSLPYGENITFSVVASNAAGLQQAAPAVTATTLHKPKPKPKKKPRKSSKKHK